MNKREVGNQYEDLAVAYLLKQGYHIVKRNFRCKMGEIDMIAYDQDYLCFIEVKYRFNNQAGVPAEAVSFYKQKRITQTAKYYMMLEQIYEDTPCRFDVVECYPERIAIIKNAFDAV